MRSVYSLPKAHLHLHLEGSARPITVAEYAQRAEVDPVAYQSFTTLSDFIPCYRAVTDTIVEPDQLIRICQELIEDEHAQGVAYSQIMVSPYLYGDRLGTVDDVFGYMCTGFDKGVASVGGGIEWALTVNADRTKGGDWAEIVALWAAEKADTGRVRAWGIASDEQHGPPDTFARAAAIARAAGLLVVPHAGETMGPDSVRGALDHMGADRISHGVRAAEDPELVARLVAEGVPLDVCPTSNHRLGVVSAYEDHNFPDLVTAGVRLTLNADDQLFFESQVAEEYDKVRRVFGTTDSELAAIARTSADASGASAGTIARMHADIDAWLAAPAPSGGTS